MINFDIVIVSSPGSALGTGGMVTKLTAAELATAAGVTTFIARGSTPQNILQILEEVTVCNSRMATPTRSRPHTPTRSRPHSPVDRQDASSVLSSPHPTVHINSTHPNLLYTCFLAEKTPLRDRKWWIKHGIHTAGTLVVDQGAVHAIFRYKASLFAAGIVEVKGHFVAQQGVRVVFAYRDAASKDNTIQYLEVGHGLVNYSSAEIQRIRGRSSAEIQEILGYAYADCVIHRQNLSRTMTHEEWKRWASEHLA
jgi:glutamate 5-kinase